MRQLHARVGIDFADQSVEHVPEQLDMIVIEPARTVGKEGGDAPQRLRSARRGAMPDHVVEFRNE
jgi:hypothetical protein